MTNPRYCLLVIVAMATTVIAQQSNMFHFPRNHKRPRITKPKDMFSGVSCSEKKIIVNLHNSMRTAVANGSIPGQPGASNMERLIWDDRLQTTAQRWANRMVFQHSDNKDSRFTIGENLYISFTSDKSSVGFNWQDAVQAWFDEHKLYRYKPAEFDPKTGHYTQLVWANTQYVGCGAVQFNEGGWVKKLYVCNYGPAGNYLGEYPYIQGNESCQKLCCTSHDCSKLYGDNCQ